MASERDNLTKASRSPRRPSNYPTETSRWNSAGLVEVGGSTPVPPAEGPSLAAMVEVVAFQESAEQVSPPILKHHFNGRLLSLYLPASLYSRV